jgi:hypothetical protein
MENFMSRPQNTFLRLRSVTRVMTAAFQLPIYTIANRPFERDGYQRVRPSWTQEAKSAGLVFSEDHSCWIFFSR